MQLNLLVIKTDQMPLQVAFYTALGIQFDYHHHGNGPMHYASVGSTPTFEIYPLPKGVLMPDTTTRLGFVVENLSALINKLQTQGIHVVSPPAHTEWGFTAVVQDWDGRKVELLEKK